MNEGESSVVSFPHLLLLVDGMDCLMVGLYPPPRSKPLYSGAVEFETVWTALVQGFTLLGFNGRFLLAACPP